MEERRKVREQRRDGREEEGKGTDEGWKRGERGVGDSPYQRYGESAVRKVV